MAVDVIADMVTSARLDADELETERGVILEELAMNDDDPSDVVHEQFAALVLGEHALGRPDRRHPRHHPRGPARRGVGALPRALPVLDARGHGRGRCRPRPAVQAGHRGAAHAAVGRLDDGRPAARSPAVQHRARSPGSRASRRQGVERTIRRPTEQANVIVGGTSLTATDPRRFTLSVLNAVLGGGMSSRLFQEIRERRGLAYSTYSFASGHADTGIFGLYAGCTPGRVDEVVALMVEEWERIAQTPPSRRPSSSVPWASCPVGSCSAWRTPGPG